MTDCANWEQLGIVIRYVYQQKPVERLIEPVKCDNIRGEAMILTFRTAVLRLTMVQEISQENNGAARNFQKKKILRMIEHYIITAPHELNLALTKASRVPEVFNMVCLLQSLGRFFASSSKRQRLFEKIIQEKVDQTIFNKIKEKIKPLCETRWVERHTAFKDLDVLYLCIISCLEIISKSED